MSADRVLAGAAAYNTGEYAIARSVWAGEDPTSPGDRTDSPLLDGLTAFVTAVTRSRRGEWPAALNAATTAQSACEPVENGVNAVQIQRWLVAFSADPEMAERSPPPTIAVDGDRPTPGQIPLAAAALVAGAVAETRGTDPTVIADGVRFANEHEYPERSRYATFIRDYASADANQRPIIFERLAGLVERERRKEDDVDGLFD